VNVTARLASAAAPGEALVTLRAATAARLDLDMLGRQSLDLKGREQATEVVRVTVHSPERIPT
jgi:class 3 adenylate cyclase